MSLPNPIVLLDARARYVHPAFQMTRASTKTVFDSTGKLVTAPANAIGWDHHPATRQARGYLAEPSATNLILHSNDLSDGAWTKGNASITANAITGPDGNGMAKLVEDSNVANHTLSQTVTITDGADVVVSQTVKAAERPLATLLLRNSSLNPQNVRINYNSDNGTIESFGESDASVLGSGAFDLGGGFYRFWLAANFGAGVTGIIVQNRLRDGNGNNLYQGDGASGLYIGYCQAEEGSYPTSYIETAGSAAARLSETLRLPNVDQMPWWSSVRGTVIADITLTAWLGFAKLLELGTAAHIRAATFVARISMVAGDFDLSPSNPTFVGSDDYHKRHIYAVAWDEDGLSVAVDGEIMATGDRQDTTAITSLSLMSSASGPTQTAFGHIHRAAYYPARLSNADLQSLTAIQE